jgi:hypothetical protein
MLEGDRLTIDTERPSRHRRLPNRPDHSARLISPYPDNLGAVTVESDLTVSRAESALGVPAGAERTLPRSHCVARPPALGSLQPEGAGPLTGPRDGEQQISRHVTTASPIHRPQHLPAGRSSPPPCERASPGSQACALDHCAQSIRYDKAILVGNGHAWRAVQARAVVSRSRSAGRVHPFGG